MNPILGDIHWCNGCATERVERPAALCAKCRRELVRDVTGTVPEAIEAQLQWLREGKKRAVLLTPGCVLPDLRRLDCVEVASVQEGLVLYRMDLLRPSEIYAASRENRLGDLLGYGVACKPEERGEGRGQRASDFSPPKVVVRGLNGTEKQAVVAPSERLDAALDAARQRADPGDTVSVEDGRRVIADRLRSLDQRELRVRPFDRERDALALQQAAREDRHGPLNPTHVIERGDEIVGYFGVNSLPLYRLWFHTEKMKAADSLRLLFMIENHYRMAGVPLIGTIINTGSPFYAVAARGGYLESSGDRLFLKDL